MIRFLISIALTLLGNAIGLLIAASVLDDMTIDGSAFVVAVAIFTLVEVIAQPLVRQIAMTNVRALLGSTALVTTFLGLLVTSLVNDGLVIEGWTTWVLATLIVWLAAMLAAIVLPLIFLKKAVDTARS